MSKIRDKGTAHHNLYKTWGESFWELFPKYEHKRLLMQLLKYCRQIGKEVSEGDGKW